MIPSRIGTKGITVTLENQQNYWVLTLASDSTAAPKGFQTLTLPFLLRYELFMAVEILPFVLLNQFFGKPTDQVSPSTYLIAVASLFLIPFYHLGVANDFVMRASIPALAILAIRTGHTAYDVFSNDRKWRKALMAVVLALGSLTGLDQIYHIVASQNHGISSCDLVQQRQQERPDLVLMWMYFANETRVPMWLKPAAPEIYATGLSAEPCNQKHIR
jgi:hypothetical protein